MGPPALRLFIPRQPSIYLQKLTKQKMTSWNVCLSDRGPNVDGIVPTGGQTINHLFAKGQYLIWMNL